MFVIDNSYFYNLFLYNILIFAMRDGFLNFFLILKIAEFNTEIAYLSASNRST